MQGLLVQVAVIGHAGCVRQRPIRTELVIMEELDG